jgi:hypothetical protein
MTASHFTETAVTRQVRVAGVVWLAVLVSGLGAALLGALVA